jgi:hypothetical protein
MISGLITPIRQATKADEASDTYDANDWLIK